MLRQFCTFVPGLGDGSSRCRRWCIPDVKSETSFSHWLYGARNFVETRNFCENSICDCLCISGKGLSDRFSLDTRQKSDVALSTSQTDEIKGLMQAQFSFPMSFFLDIVDSSNLSIP